MCSGLFTTHHKRNKGRGKACVVRNPPERGLCHQRPASPIIHQGPAQYLFPSAPPTHASRQQTPDSAQQPPPNPIQSHLPNPRGTNHEQSGEMNRKAYLDTTIMIEVPSPKQSHTQQPAPAPSGHLHHRKPQLSKALRHRLPMTPPPPSQQN